jgi:hypothetical protein
MLNKKLQALLEELQTTKGDAAAKPEATKEETPDVYKVQLANKEVYSKDEHKEVEEIEEVIVEGKVYSEKQLRRLFENLGLDTHKYSFNYLAEQLGFELLEDEFTDKGEVAHYENEATDEDDAETDEPDTDNDDIYPDDEHDEDEEVEGIVVENEIYSRRELIELFEKLELDTDKYTFKYLSEQLGFVPVIALTEEELNERWELGLTQASKERKQVYKAAHDAARAANKPKSS